LLVLYIFAANLALFIALCAFVKPREAFESAASRHFQKLLYTI